MYTWRYIRLFGGYVEDCGEMGVYVVYSGLEGVRRYIYLWLAGLSWVHLEVVLLPLHHSRVPNLPIVVLSVRLCTATLSYIVLPLQRDTSYRKEKH